MGLSAGLVSANCFDFTDDITLNTTTEYEVYLYSGIEGSTPEVHSVDQDDIHIYASFRLSTLMYNVAVIEFNKESTSTVKTYLMGDSYRVGDSTYIQRTVDEDKGTWNAPYTLHQDNDPTDLCNKTDGLFQTNSFYLACSTNTFSSAHDGSCAMPYSALYTEIDNELVLIALYSHSVLIGTDMCKDTLVSYYTYTMHYVMIAANILKRPVDLIRLHSGISNSTTFPNNEHRVSPPNTVDMTGKKRIGGNLYEKQVAIPSTTETEISSTESSTPTNHSEESTSSGMSNTSKAIIGAVVPSSAIVVAIIAILGYRYWKKKHTLKSWKPHEEQLHMREPHEEQLHMREVANDLVADEVVRPPQLRPPPYAATLDTPANNGSEPAAAAAAENNSAVANDEKN
ncbi:hypothetical protein GGI15_001715 [Coemansia interrupta]|uniref:Uncharacterized protein n=1 Tax=Coemansia interrupta TaxID=1126814 RepID=A0A9W8LM54_9FUNG|nr:hypothetical protein GGI15_001715 [Coemansia interrupta]